MTLRLFLPTIGSTGDLHPFLALAHALTARGHAVTLGAYPMHAAKAGRYGTDVREMPPNITAAHLVDQVERLTAWRGNQIWQSQMLLKELLLKDAEARFEAALPLVRAADVVVCHDFDFPVQFAARREGRPWVSVAFCPVGLATGDRALDIKHWVNLGRTLNRATWRLGDFLIRHVVYRSVWSMAARLGDKGDLGRLFSASPWLNLVACSPALAAVPTDLSPSIRYVGQWMMQEPEGVLPEAIAQFLAAGPPPVVVSFGSMGGGDGRALAKVVVEAVRLCGQRVIIQRGWAGLAGENADDVLFADYVPHALLFPRAACVVHHGGAGTTAATALAGVPQIVVAFGFDQYYWGMMVARQGIGAKHLVRHRLSVKKLAGRLLQVLGNEAMAGRARELARVLAEERPLEVSVRAIEEVGRPADFADGTRPRPA